MDTVSEITMSMLIVLVLLAIVTLSKPVEDGCVEIFAGQIFDLACAKTAKPKVFAGYSCTWHYLHKGLLAFIKQFFTHEKDVQTSAIPFARFAAQLCAARLRLDCTKFRRVRFADLLKVTIASNTNTISILMVTR